METKKSESILLVDDDHVSRFLISRLILRFNKDTEIILANNGEEALTILQERCVVDDNCPSLIILDINMPMMDGLEFMKVLSYSSLRERLRVVVFTTSSNENEFNVLRSLGVTEFYHKPVTDVEMKEIFRKRESDKTSV